ncbi:MAG: ABC transporter substrate-binding protein [Candidatus Binatia bacterium]
MKLAFLSTGTLLVFLGSCMFGTSTFAAVRASALEAKKEAESKGFIFHASHDDIVAKAKKEKKLNVLSGSEPTSFQELMKSFQNKYPFLEVSMSEITGAEAARRHILEVKAGRKTEFDLVNVNAVLYGEYPPYAKKFDILGMAQQGVLSIHPKMVDPNNRTIVAVGHGLTVVVYNKNLISSDKVPDRWEDFLKPEFKGRKFIVDVEPRIYSVFASCPDQGLGFEWMLNYARKIRAQEPVWIRGFTRALSMLLAGEHALHSGVNYHSAMRLKKKDATGILEVKVIEPAPLRVTHTQMILASASNPYAALLFIEHQASPEGQKIMDKYEPVQASIYTPGAILNNVVRGKKLCINSFDTFEKSSQWMKDAVEALGFPKAETGRK